MDQDKNADEVNQQKQQQDLLKSIGRPRSNAVFEPPKKQQENKFKQPGKLRQSFDSHAHFVKFMLGRAGVPEEEIEATQRQQKDAKERGIWVKPFEVPPKRRGLGEAFSSHLNFLKVLGGGGGIPEEELKDREAKKQFLDQWRKDNPGKEPEDDMDDGYEHQKLGLKDAYRAHKNFLGDLFGKDKPEPGDDEQDKGGQTVREQLAAQNKHPTRKPQSKMKLGFSFDNAKTKFKERSAAFAKKLSDSFSSKGGGQGFKYFKNLAKKLLGSKDHQTGGQEAGGMPKKFTTEIELSKAPHQFTTQTKPGLDLTAKTAPVIDVTGQNKPKPFELKKDQPKPFTLKTPSRDSITSMIPGGDKGTGSMKTPAPGTV